MSADRFEVLGSEAEAFDTCLFRRQQTDTADAGSTHRRRNIFIEEHRLNGDQIGGVHIEELRDMFIDVKHARGLCLGAVGSDDTRVHEEKLTALVSRDHRIAAICETWIDP